jgi:sugar lactone lactonase YvrE
VRAALLVALVACSGAKSKPGSASLVEDFAVLSVGPGNLAMTKDARLFISQHQFYAPKNTVVEVRTGKTAPFAEGAVDSVLGIRADERGLVWMLDNGMRNKTTRKLVSWDPKANNVERTIDLMKASPDDAFLNDLAVDRTHDAIYISDPAGGNNAALIVVDLKTNTARRVLEGDVSVVPTELDLVIDGTPVQIKLPDGKVIKPHVGVNAIALDAKDEWLYFGPMHATKLYRARTSELLAGTAKPEFYADRPITDGISIDDAGNIYLGDLANNALGVIDANRKYRELARGFSWIDSFSYGPDGYYYIVVNQLHRSAVLNAGTDATKPPFHIMRFKPLAPGHVGR